MDHNTVEFGKVSGIILFPEGNGGGFVRTEAIATRIFGRIESMGLVIRQIDPNDQRVTRIYLNEERRNLLQPVAPRAWQPDLPLNPEKLRRYKIRDNSLEDL